MHLNNFSRLVLPSNHPGKSFLAEVLTVPSLASTPSTNDGILLGVRGGAKGILSFSLRGDSRPELEAGVTRSGPVNSPDSPIHPQS